MKSFQKGFVHVGLIILIIVAIAIVGYLFFGKNIRPRPPISADNSFVCPNIAMSEDANGFLSNIVPEAHALTQELLLAGKLCFMEKPLLNRAVTLELRLFSRHDVPDAKARIEVPNDFQIVSGTADWSGSLKGGEQMNLRVTVKPTKPGYFQIKGWGSAHGSGISVDNQQLSKIDLDVNSSDTIMDPVWDQTFVLPDKLYSAVYPKHSLWTVSPNLTDDRIQKYQFGHALNPEKFDPIIAVTHFKSGYVDPSTKVAADQTEIRVSNKNTRTGRWTFYQAMKQSVNIDGKNIERVSVRNWKGYDINIDLLKPEYKQAFDTFVGLFAVLSED